LEATFVELVLGLALLAADVHVFPGSWPLRYHGVVHAATHVKTDVGTAAFASNPPTPRRSARTADARTTGHRATRRPRSCPRTGSRPSRSRAATRCWARSRTP